MSLALISREWAAEAAKRAVWTVVAIALPYVLAVQLADVPWLTVGLAAALGLATSLFTSLIKLPDLAAASPWWQLVDRSVRTGFQSLLTAASAATLITEVQWDVALQAAASAVVITLARGVLTILPEPAPIVTVSELDATTG